MGRGTNPKKNKSQTLPQVCLTFWFFIACFVFCRWGMPDVFADTANLVEYA